MCYVRHLKDNVQKTHNKKITNVRIHLCGLVMRSVYSTA